MSIFEGHYVLHHHPKKQTVINKKKKQYSFSSHTVEHWTRCVSDGILIKVPNGSIPSIFRPWINTPLIGCFDSISTKKFRK